MSTQITITVEERRTSPSRRHIQIPHNDELVHRWWLAQGDPSASVRLLVHNEVAQHGVVDAVNRFSHGSTNAATLVGPSAPVGTPVVPVPTTPFAPAGPPPQVLAKIAEMREELERLETSWATSPGIPVQPTLPGLHGDAAV